MFRLCPVASVARRQFCGATGRGLGTYKTSTGLVGLAVDPNGRENLFNLAQKVLQAVKVEDFFFLRNLCELSVFMMITSK